MEKKRLAVYIRTPINADSNVQVEYYKKAISQREDCELIEIYLDRGTSGKKKSRLMFQKMIKDAKARKFDYIICKSIEKFSRSAEIAISTIAELKESGVGVFFEKENKDTMSEDYESYAELLTQTCGFATMLREKEKQIEAEHPEWNEDEEIDENDLAQIINIEL